MGSVYVHMAPDTFNEDPGRGGAGSVTSAQPKVVWKVGGHGAVYEAPSNSTDRIAVGTDGDRYKLWA